MQGTIYFLTLCKSKIKFYFQTKKNNIAWFVHKSRHLSVLKIWMQNKSMLNSHQIQVQGRNSINAIGLLGIRHPGAYCPWKRENNDLKGRIQSLTNVKQIKQSPENDPVYALVDNPYDASVRMRNLPSLPIIGVWLGCQETPANIFGSALERKYIF